MKNFKYSTKCSCIICNQETTTQSLNKHYESHLKPIITKTCPKCKSIHSNHGIFCSRICANSRTPSELTKQKTANTLKEIFSVNPPIKKYPEYTPISFCTNCSKLFIGLKSTCSQECLTARLQSAGKKSASVQIKRSRDEITLYELCKSYFSNVEHNQPIFEGWDADIIIHDIKTAILWNGPWHYKDLGFNNHSLKQVQNRDKLKINIINKMGWKSLVFEDRYYTPKQAFSFLISQISQISKEAGAGFEHSVHEGYEPCNLPLI
jgi:hypothetical protein